MCTYFFHLYSCGCAHIDLKRTLLAHCLAVNRAVACWHIQVKYRTLEVNCPGTTLPQPRPCPLVLTREQLAQTEAQGQRDLREDMIKRVMGSFNGNVELQRSIKEELDRDLEAANNRVKQVETKQWARSGRQKLVIDRLSKTNFSKPPSTRESKEGNQVNLEYPPSYLAHIQALEFHQQRLDLSPNTVIENIAYGCGRKSDPICLSGHIREGKHLCPWLIAQRLKGEDEDPEEFATLRDIKCRGGAKMDLDNPSESEFIRSAIVYRTEASRKNQVIAANKKLNVGPSRGGDLLSSDFVPSSYATAQSLGRNTASKPRSFPLHFEHGTHTSPPLSLQNSPHVKNREIGVTAWLSSTVEDASYDEHSVGLNPEAQPFRPGVRIHKRDTSTKRIIETRNLSEVNYLEIQQVVPRNPQLSTGEFVHWQGEALWGTGVQRPSAAPPANTVIFPAGTSFLHFDPMTSRHKASSGPLTRGRNTGTQLQSCPTHSSAAARSKSSDMHSSTTNRPYLGVAPPYNCRLVSRDLSSRTQMASASPMQLADLSYRSPGGDGRFPNTYRRGRGRGRGCSNSLQQVKSNLSYSGLTDARTNKIDSLTTVQTRDNIQSMGKATFYTAEPMHATSLAPIQASMDSTRRASSVPSSPLAPAVRSRSSPPVFSRPSTR